MATRSTLEELDSVTRQRADCVAVTRMLRLDGSADAVAPGPAGPAYGEVTHEVTTKPEIEVSEAARRLANALHLHLD